MFHCDASSPELKLSDILTNNIGVSIILHIAKLLHRCLPITKIVHENKIKHTQTGSFFLNLRSHIAVYLMHNYTHIPYTDILILRYNSIIGTF